jgi:Zn-dependent peptidase ImmA (M78 family)
MPEENEANIFAAELLLDDKTVLEHLSEESFFEAASALYVPAALLDYKFMILRSKGYRLNTVNVRKSDFLREDLGAYDAGIDRFQD